MTELDGNTAKQIVDAIIADGAEEAYMAASEDDRTEMMLAYMQNLIRKTEIMQTMYLTNDEFRGAFRETVRELCVAL